MVREVVRDRKIMGVKVREVVHPVVELLPEYLDPLTWQLFPLATRADLESVDMKRRVALARG